MEKRHDIPPEELPGVKKKSFSMFFGGSELWFEHLDGMHEHTALVLDKLERDYAQFRRPSMPSLMAINLDETTVNPAIINAIAEKLLNGGKRLMKVAVVGAERASQRAMAKALANAPFALGFINDFEKAKEWLVGQE